MSAFFICESRFFTSREKLFSFHENPEGFDTLVGLDKNVKVLQKPGSLQKGAVAILQVQIFPGISAKWVAKHTDYIKNELFVDEQEKGPFLKFRHEHRFLEDGVNSILQDRIEFDFWALPISKYAILGKLKAQFLKRHKATASFLEVKYQNLFCGLKKG